MSDHTGRARFHQVPGFAVFFQSHFFGAKVRVEAEHGGGHAGFDGDMRVPHPTRFS